MSKEEYSHICDNCGSSGSSTHARTYPRKLNGLWLQICSSCWSDMEEVGK